MFVDRRIIMHFDWLLFAIICGIPLVGTIVLYSAGYEPEGSVLRLPLGSIEVMSLACAKQVLNFFIGLLALCIGIAIPPKFLHRIGPFIYFIGLAALIAVPFIGQESHGSQRWLSLGGWQFQPSELMKFAVIIFLARIIAKYPPDSGGYGIKGLLLPMAIILIPVALVVKQPDLGTGLALAASALAMVLFMGVRLRILVFCILSVLVFLLPTQISPYKPLVLEFLEPYQQRRVMGLLDPEVDMQGSGWHIRQSKIAVGSGQLLGKGFMQGSQTQLKFLPEHTTDFIFSVLAEEWGFLGSLFLLFLYFLLLYRILHVVSRSKDLFSSLIAFGVCAQIFFHMFVNIGMVIGLLPVVGLPLPLMSYGGSSVVTTMFSLGLVLGVAMRRSIFATAKM